MVSWWHNSPGYISLQQLLLDGVSAANVYAYSRKVKPLCDSLLGYPVVLGGINILLPVYGITNSKRYSVFHGILIKHN